MMILEQLHEYAKQLEKLLRLRTFPFAVKMLNSEQDVPREAKRPVKDLGYHLDVCQGFAMSRREGATVAMMKEDMWCFEPVVGYGLAEPPKYFLDGHNRYPASAMTLEAGGKWARSFPRLRVGEYIGIVSTPLGALTFVPDLFVVYCDPSQLTQLLRAKICIDGGDITNTLSGHAACVYAIVPLIQDKQNQQCQVVSPCRGDRIYAMAKEEEIIFSAQIEMLGHFITALQYLQKQGSGFPDKLTYQPEHELIMSYEKIGEMLGMKFR